jgi:antitoxin PrlF
MAFSRSKLTSQGQISVPLAVRRRLGLSPGGSLEWIEEDGRIIVRRAGDCTSEDINRALFPEGPPRRRSLKSLKEGIREYTRKRHAVR